MFDSLDDILKLAEEERQDWLQRLAQIPSWHPRNEGEDDDGDDDDNDDDTGGDGDAAKDDDKKIDWKAMARKHERAAKKERKERERLEREAKDRGEADQSEHEKAVQAAREEGEKKARDESDSERRADRLENATLKLAAKGFKITVKEGDEEKTVTMKFADPDDATTYIERMIRRGDLDEDDIFDDKGKVDTNALQEALTELLEDKPHLQATGAGSGNGDGGSKERTRVGGRADGGKGSGGKSTDEMSVDDHLQAIKRHK